jgi:pilus assembly protein CpaC
VRTTQQQAGNNNNNLGETGRDAGLAGMKKQNANPGKAGLLSRLAATAAIGAMLAIAASIQPTAALAEDNGVVQLNTSGTQVVRVGQGKPRTMRADQIFSEIVVGDPDVAVVTPLTDRTFYVVGSKPGSTGVALYNEARELVGMLDIEVGPDAGEINRTLNAALNDDGVKATTANGRVIISGKAKSPAAAAKAQEIAKRFDEDPIVSTSVAPSTQVTLEVRFIEASRRHNKEVGVSLFANKEGGYFTTANNGLIANPLYEPLGSAGGVRVINSLVSGTLPFGQVLGRLLDSGMKVDALVQALEQRGVARRLAEPNLTALSGDTASFLAGGEFPFPVSSADGQVSVEFKKFGVGLDFTPTVLDNGIINLQIAPEVSQIDPTSSVKFNDTEIPGLIVRRAKTTVELRDGQSFVLAGLLQTAGNYDIRKFPWLGDLPILGVLFRSSSFRKQETDLVIIVTPRLVRPLAPGANIATPLDGAAPPNDVDLFLKGKTEINRAHLRRVAEASAGALRSGHVIEY